MVNLREVLEPIDMVRKVARVRVEDAYNSLLLRHGMTLGTGAMLRGIQMLIRQLHRSSAALLARFWNGAPPDLVVSLIPNFNRAIFDGLRAERSRTQSRADPDVHDPYRPRRLSAAFLDGARRSNISCARPNARRSRRLRWDIRASAFSAPRE